MSIKKVISCSRRTDVPRCFSGWLEERLAAGNVTFRAPQGAVRSVSLKTDDVHSIVLWSKSYGPLLKRPGLIERLRALGPFFHFTITGLGQTAWEPDVPGWAVAIEEMAGLVGVFGSDRVSWRFDPVVHWWEEGRVSSNLPLFATLAEKVAGLGVSKCTFSFAQWYNKSLKRAQKTGLRFVDPALEEKLAAAGAMATTASELGIAIAGCSNNDWLAVPGIAKASCVDGSLLGSLRGDGLRASLARDRSQRQLCGCTSSIDIGSYTQRCGGQPCVYCYAN